MKELGTQEGNYHSKLVKKKASILSAHSSNFLQEKSFGYEKCKSNSWVLKVSDIMKSELSSDKQNTHKSSFHSFNKQEYINMKNEIKLKWAMPFASSPYLESYFPITALTRIFPYHSPHSYISLSESPFKYFPIWHQITYFPITSQNHIFS